MASVPTLLLCALLLVAAIQKSQAQDRFVCSFAPNSGCEFVEATSCVALDLAACAASPFGFARYAQAGNGDYSVAYFSDAACTAQNTVFVATSSQLNGCSTVSVSSNPLAQFGVFEAGCAACPTTSTTTTTATTTTTTTTVAITTTTTTALAGPSDPGTTPMFQCSFAAGTNCEFTETTECAPLQLDVCADSGRGVFFFYTQDPQTLEYTYTLYVDAACSVEFPGFTVDSVAEGQCGSLRNAAGASQADFSVVAAGCPACPKDTYYCTFSPRAACGEGSLASPCNRIQLGTCANSGLGAFLRFTLDPDTELYQLELFGDADCTFALVDFTPDRVSLGQCGGVRDGTGTSLTDFGVFPEGCPFCPPLPTSQAPTQDPAASTTSPPADAQTSYVACAFPVGRCSFVAGGEDATCSPVVGISTDDGNNNGDDTAATDATCFQASTGFFLRFDLSNLPIVDAQIFSDSACKLPVPQLRFDAGPAGECRDIAVTTTGAALAHVGVFVTVPNCTTCTDIRVQTQTGQLGLWRADDRRDSVVLDSKIRPESPFPVLDARLERFSECRTLDKFDSLVGLHFSGWELLAVADEEGACPANATVANAFVLYGSVRPAATHDLDPPYPRSFSGPAAAAGAEGTQRFLFPPANVQAADPDGYSVAVSVATNGVSVYAFNEPKGQALALLVWEAATPLDQWTFVAVEVNSRHVWLSIEGDIVASAALPLANFYYCPSGFGSSTYGGFDGATNVLGVTVPEEATDGSPGVGIFKSFAEVCSLTVPTINQLTAGAFFESQPAAVDSDQDLELEFVIRETVPRNDGIFINATTGALFGAPRQASETLRIVVGANALDSKCSPPDVVVTVDVYPPVVLEFDPGSLPDPDTSVAARYDSGAVLLVAGGDGEFAFDATNLPPGISIDPATGAITGVASSPGTYGVGISATDGNGGTDFVNFTLKVYPPVVLQGVRTFATRNAFFTRQAQQPTGGESPFFFRFDTLSPAAAQVLTGLVLDNVTGELYGVPAVDTFSLVDGTTSSSPLPTVGVTAATSTPAAATTTTAGTRAASATTTKAAGRGRRVEDTGISFALLITDVEGATAREQVILEIAPELSLALETSQLRVGAGENLDQPLATAAGGRPLANGGYEYTLRPVGPTDAPQGLTVTSDGRLTGIVASAGDYKLEVLATDRNGATVSSSTPVTLAVSEAPSPSDDSLSAGSIVGIILACAAVFALLVIFLLLHRRKRVQKHDFAPWFQTVLGQDNARVPKELPRSAIERLDELGHGAFGTVYKGTLREDRAPKYLVALKVLRGDCNEADRQALLSEALIMAQVKHERIVGLVGVVTIGEPVIVALQYMEHGSLDVYLRNRTGIAELSQRGRAKIARDVADGMRYLETAGYLHRDLAARNVLVDSAHRCNISDFGLARELHEDEDYYRSSNGRVPVRWMPPEVLKGRLFSHKSDVWSFGVVVFEIWTKGERPYKNWTNEHVYIEVMEGYRLEMPEGMHPDVADVVNRCWDTEPAQRPTFAQLFERFEILAEQLAEGGHMLGSTASTKHGTYNTSGLGMSSSFGESGGSSWPHSSSNGGTSIAPVTPNTSAGYAIPDDRRRRQHSQGSNYTQADEGQFSGDNNVSLLSHASHYTQPDLDGPVVQHPGASTTEYAIADVDLQREQQQFDQSGVDQWTQQHYNADNASAYVLPDMDPQLLVRQPEQSDYAQADVDQHHEEQLLNQHLQNEPSQSDQVQLHDEHGLGILGAPLPVVLAANGYHQRSNETNGYGSDGAAANGVSGGGEDIAPASALDDTHGYLAIEMNSHPDDGSDDLSDDGSDDLSDDPSDQIKVSVV